MRATRRYVGGHPVSAAFLSISVIAPCLTESAGLYYCRNEPLEQTLLRRGAPSGIAGSSPGRASATRCSTTQSMATAGYTLPTYLHPHDNRLTPETPNKLDDGWPESVEEQGLLLLVWRHIFTNNI
jgi:hypothetical protein